MQVVVRVRPAKVNEAQCIASTSAKEISLALPPSAQGCAAALCPPPARFLTADF